ncbi:MBL fold metallo-hydrolase [Streptomyces spiroverticillatus]|uniref:MBL fold metallo-hydrolase n=1 Tax=Streptomyces finlayi TaxID=67296 RepID=A0A918X949_9ACTN|nr:MBL fold metallo-hydrolase [Streptomyces finlayi]GHA48631.1 MBL fold metallo-hydrolase [Streptomyces spiroverticillatus]GHD19003.1 MBL fold metallo-hydrolase [Streptomyces finlayi]
MDLVEILPQLHMLRFPIGQAYLWREETSDGTELTLVDAGNRDAAADIEEAIRSLGADPRDLRRIVLTHCHRDHVGCAEELAARHGAEVLAHRLDAPVVRGVAPTPEAVLLDWELPLYEHGLTVPEAPATRVDRELEEGDVLDFGGGARIVHAPGHTDGSLAVHLPDHGVLFTGDCIASVGEVMLGVFNVDRDQALATMRRLASLAPTVVLVGHGDPVTEDTTTRLITAADKASTGQ